MTVIYSGVPTPGNGLSQSAGPLPINPYRPIVQEHMPWGVDTPHNLIPMDLHPTQKNDGVVRPQRVINKGLNMGNPLKIFAGLSRLVGSQPTNGVDGAS